MYIADGYPAAAMPPQAAQQQSYPAGVPCFAPEPGFQLWVVPGPGQGPSYFPLPAQCHNCHYAGPLSVRKVSEDSKDCFPSLPLPLLCCGPRMECLLPCDYHSLSLFTAHVDPLFGSTCNTALSRLCCTAESLVSARAEPPSAVSLPQESGACTWVSAGLLCLMGAWICSPLPFCCALTKDQVIRCPQCGMELCRQLP